MKRILLTLAPLSLVLAAPAAAQVAPGMQITDASGAPVGTVKSVDGDNLVVKTDKHEVALPKSSFTPSEGKLLFGMTQAQLNAEIEKSLAAADAAVTAGATVQGLQGGPLGTIETADADTVTIKLQSGQLVRVARTAVRGNADGTVTVGLTAEQLQAQIEPAAAPAGSQGK